MSNFIIDAEFQAIIPPLSAREFEQLEANILRDGIREPLVIWNGIIVDGHNRYAIAQKHNLPFNTVEMHFDNRADAIEWIVTSQFGRRNISVYDRVCLALKLKPAIAEKARARMTAGAAVDPTPNLAQGTTLEQIAQIAGVGKETVRKVELINKSAPVHIIDFLKRGDISIHMAYEATRREFDHLAEHTECIKRYLLELKKSAREILRRLDVAESRFSPAEFHAWCIENFGSDADSIRAGLETLDLNTAV